MATDPVHVAMMPRAVVSPINWFRRTDVSLMDPLLVPMMRLAEHWGLLSAASLIGRCTGSIPVDELGAWGPLIADAVNATRLSNRADSLTARQPTTLTAEYRGGSRGFATEFVLTTAIRDHRCGAKSLQNMRMPGKERSSPIRTIIRSTVLKPSAW